MSDQKDTAGEASELLAFVKSRRWCNAAWILECPKGSAVTHAVSTIDRAGVCKILIPKGKTQDNRYLWETMGYNRAVKLGYAA